MVNLDLPPFLVEAHDLAAIKRCVAGHQIQRALAAVFVRKDLLDQKQWEGNLFQMHLPCLPVFESQRLDCLKAPIFLVLPRQSDVAVGLQRHHEVLLQLGLDQFHVVCRREPHIFEDVAERQAVLDAGFEHRLVVRVLAHGRSPLGLSRLFVCERFVFFDQSEGHGQRDLIGAVKRRQEVDAFDACSCGMVIVPADELALVGVRLVGDTIVHDQHGIFSLHLPHERLHDLPQVGRSIRLL